MSRSGAGKISKWRKKKFLEAQEEKNPSLAFETPSDEWFFVCGSQCVAPHKRLPSPLRGSFFGG